jgi:hypothetical protein
VLLELDIPDLGSWEVGGRDLEARSWVYGN